MIKCIRYDIGWQVICNKCGRYTPITQFSKLRDLVSRLGWYTLDISPRRGHSYESIDICTICAKKYTLAQLG